MKKLLKYILVGSVTLLTTWSCRENWDTHYGETPGLKSDLNLFEYIKSQPDLSTFAHMLEIAGYDSLFAQNQTFTVWAPVNDALAGLDMTDTVYIANLAKNHVSRFNLSTSNIDFRTIYMMNSKFLNFVRNGNDFYFGNQKLIGTDVATQNGTVHKLNNYIPYLRNIWEFIGSQPGLDSLRNYLYSQNTSVFDAEHSVEIGTNEFNQAIYDSVIIFSNPILDQIGMIHLEDSIYGAILPDNEAWANIYGQISARYVTLPDDGGAPQQRLNAQRAIVDNLIFRLQDKEENMIVNDSLISTSGTKFMTPSYLFDNSLKYQLSNGVAYVTDSLRFKVSDAWQKTIKIEAENSEYGRSFDYANLYVRSGLGASLPVSANKYLVCEPTTVSWTTPNSVTFPIPNTLSGEYDIYCTFLPSSIVKEDDLRPYKVSFTLSYLDNKGNETSGVVTSTHQINSKLGFKPAVFTSEKDTITKMFVARFSFPYCNIIGKNFSNSDIKVKLKVENAAKITETVRFDRTIRIDHVSMEPVQN